MNFRGHFNGGVVAGGLAVGVALGTQYVHLQPEDWQQFTQHPFALEGNIQTLLSVFATALFMALFPDLDTTSVPQRWFFRGMFVLLAVLYFQQRMELFCLLAFVSLMPVMHKHRGWTHWKITPWLIAVFLAMVWEYFRVKEAWVEEFSWDNVWRWMQEYWIYVFACVIGHYTHLLLDSRKIRWLPFVANSTKHH
jgi:hypothetical protein